MNCNINLTYVVTCETNLEDTSQEGLQVRVICGLRKYGLYMRNTQLKYFHRTDGPAILKLFDNNYLVRRWWKHYREVRKEQQDSSMKGIIREF